MRVFLVANSPGELSAWVRPIATTLKERAKDTNISVIIPPCQYASGTEKQVTGTFPSVDGVVGPTEYLKYIVLGIRWPHFGDNSKGVAVFLGGDPIHTILLSKRLRVPALAYIQKPRWKRFFKKFLILDQTIKEEFVRAGVKSRQIRVVGDLMADAVECWMSKEETCNHWELDPTCPIVSIMPGSRSQEVRYLTPFFLRVAEQVRAEVPKAQFVVVLSPFTSHQQLTNLPSEGAQEVFRDRAEFKLVKKKRWKLITDLNLEVLVASENQYEIMNASDLAITIPGTNTAEMAFLGTPMVVVIPLNKPEAIPLDGLPELIGHLPYLGPLTKAVIVRRYSRKVEFTALPNLRAGKEIVPELRGKIRAQDVSMKVIELLQDPVLRNNMACELKSVMGPKGAANRMAETILQEFN